MLSELVRYHRPGSLRDALQLLRQPHTIALAGGTELLARQDASTIAVVDLQDAGLEYVREDTKGTSVGAMTRVQAFVDHPFLNSLAEGLLERAAALMTNTERQAATAGGALAAGPAHSDLLAALLVLDASLVVQTADTQTQVSAAALLAERSRFLSRGALITEIYLPIQPPDGRFRADRVSRTTADRAIVCMAVRLVKANGKLTAVRIAAGGAASHVIRLLSAEAALEDSVHDALHVREAARAAMEATSPQDDALAPAEYRRAMVGVLLERLVRQAAAPDTKEQHA